jgi:two-component system OmpR family response regulator
MNAKRQGAAAGEEHWPPLRILCVDDHRDCADSAALLYKVMGFDTRACYDGLTALRLNESFRPGACFLDLQMPGMAGDELAIKLRTSPGWRPLLIVAMTAMSNEESCVRIRNAAFDMHLVKPVSPAKIIEVTNRLFQIAESIGLPKQRHG